LLSWQGSRCRPAGWRGSAATWRGSTRPPCAPSGARTATPSTAWRRTSSTAWTTRSSGRTPSRRSRPRRRGAAARSPSRLALRRTGAGAAAAAAQARTAGGARGRRGTTAGTVPGARWPSGGRAPRTCCAPDPSPASAARGGTGRPPPPPPPPPPPRARPTRRTSSPATGTSTRSRTRRRRSSRCTAPRPPSTCGIRPSRSPTASASPSSGSSPAPSTAPTSTASRQDGSQVSPELYGDSRPRLFTYWTSDAYEATGCYNALCPGFVQTSSRIAIGASISPVSSAGGAQYDMTLLVWKDPKLGNWWLSYGDQLVGYWPAQLFTHLSDHATMVEWGGEVVDTRPGGAHTATQMGSGRFAAEGFGRASYFRNLETVDADNSLAEVALDAIQTLAEDPACYDIRKAYDDDDDDDDDGQHSARGGWGTHFYYGGPGHNPACP
uniref:Neprosin PEP catalytic domain-containing protein n=1 Tax=Zea mays TaxID=4577 RepID=A0A804LV14_MAIZE